MKYVANPVEVEAEIIEDTNPVEPDGSMVLLVRGDGTLHTVRADQGMLARYLPKKGDYVVTQADGYVYLNPKEVFERKYRPWVARPGEKRA